MWKGFLAFLGSCGIGHGQLIFGAVAIVAVLAAGGTGYVWGVASATRQAIEIANAEAQSRINALDESYKALIRDYEGKLKAQRARGEELAAELNAERAKNAADAKAAKEKLANVQDQSLDLAVPAAVLVLLRDQAARR